MRVPTTLDRSFDSLPTIHDAPDDVTPNEPCRAIWISVVALCWADAWGITSDYQLYSQDPMFRRDEGTMKPDSDAITIEAYRAICRNWLIQDFGDFKYDRELCCDLAGIDPDMLRNAAKAKLKQVKGDETTGEVIEIDRLFARLLANEASMTPADIDTALAELAKLEFQAA